MKQVEQNLEILRFWLGILRNIKDTYIFKLQSSRKDTEHLCFRSFPVLRILLLHCVLLNEVVVGSLSVFGIWEAIVIQSGLNWHPCKRAGNFHICAVYLGRTTDIPKR
jgi:hypothetical protein